MSKYEENNADVNMKKQRDIHEQSRRSGLSYNEAKEWIAHTTGGYGTHIYSDTNIEEVRQKNQASKSNQHPKNNDLN